MSRKLVPIALLALAGVLVIFSVSLNAIIGKNRNRIQQDLEKSLGRAVAFGELGVSFWGGPGVSAKDLTIADDPRFAATPFIQAKELRMQLRWLPLLAGRFQIDRFILDEPEIQIIKNETGLTNIATLATHEEAPAGPGDVKERKRPSAPRLMIASLHIKNGSIDYIDRTSKEPVEVRVLRLDLAVRGGLNDPAKIKITANLFENQGRNLTVEGQVGPWPLGTAWSRVPLDLQLRCDSLLLSQLTRAIPALRTTALRYLDATGPVAVKSKLRGTFERPHIIDLDLIGAFFGASENNTSIKGDLDFTKAESWTDGAVKTRIVIDPLVLDRLKTLPFFRQTPPSALRAEGPVSVDGELQGTLNALKIRATVKAGQSEIVYGNWLKKTKGVPAEIRLDMERSKERLVFQEASLAIQDSKVKFSGSIDELPEPRLTLQVSAAGVSPAGWEKLFPPLAGYNLGGKIDWNLSVKKNLSSEDGFDVRGGLSFDGVQMKEKKSGRGVERATGRISFHGNDARVERLALRAGSSEILLEGAVADLSQPALRYSLSSAVLNLGDLISGAAYKKDEMKSLASAGELQFKAGKVSIRGNVASAEGMLQDVPYLNLRGEVVWSPASLSLKNLSFQAMSGNLRAGGSWEKGAENSFRLALYPIIESMDLKALLARKFPAFKDRVDGRLNLKAKLTAESKNVSGLPESIVGDGEAEIRNGSLNDFNLMQLVLSKISGVPGMSKMRVPPRFTALAERKDTRFDSLSATFTIRQGRIYSHDLLFSAAEYSVSADGSIGLDKSMKWDATLVMSSPFTEELMREYKNVRAMVDGKGRLVVPFRLEGRLPRVQVQPDLQKLGQQIQKGLPAKGAEARSADGEKAPSKKSRRERKALERRQEK
jgi:hypothetical protein